MQSWWKPQAAPFSHYKIIDKITNYTIIKMKEWSTMVFHSVTKSKQRVEAYKKVNVETIIENDLEMKDMQYA